MRWSWGATPTREGRRAAARACNACQRLSAAVVSEPRIARR
jgi:hypothetical protein